MSAFGQQVLDARERRGLSREQVRRMTGVHPNTLRNIELGVSNPTVDIREKLTAALGLAPSGPAVPTTMADLSGLINASMEAIIEAEVQRRLEERWTKLMQLGRSSEREVIAHEMELAQQAAEGAAKRR